MTAEFAIKVSTGAGDHHFFGTVGTEGYRAALAIEQGWRSETRPGAYYTFTEPCGSVNVYVRDIVDVSITVGGQR